MAVWCVSGEPVGLAKAVWRRGPWAAYSFCAGEEGRGMGGGTGKKALFKAPEMEYNKKRDAAGKSRGTNERGERT